MKAKPLDIGWAEELRRTGRLMFATKKDLLSFYRFKRPKTHDRKNFRLKYRAPKAEGT